MDPYTLDHLTHWIDKTLARTEDEAAGILAGMLAYIAANADDLARIMDNGWMKAYDEAFCPKCMGIAGAGDPPSYVYDAFGNCAPAFDEREPEDMGMEE